MTHSRRFRRAMYIFLMLAPVIAILGFLTIYPTIRGVEISLQNLRVFNFGRERFVGWENFERIFQDPGFWPIVVNTVQWVFFSVLFQSFLGLGLALLMRRPFRGRGMYAGFVFYPWALSGYAIGLVWSWLLNGQFGVVNDLLIRMGWIDQGISFLSSPEIAMPSVIFVNVWYGIPFFAIMIMAALQSVPIELYEAAEMDGASRIRQFFGITLPFIRPTLLNTILIRSIWVMNFPDIIYGMTRGGPAGSTNILSVYMINIVYYENHFSKASAVGVIMLSFLLVYTLIYLRLSGAKEIEL